MKKKKANENNETKYCQNERKIWSVKTKKQKQTKNKTKDNKKTTTQKHNNNKKGAHLGPNRPTSLITEQRNLKKKKKKKKKSAQVWVSKADRQV